MAGFSKTIPLLIYINLCNSYYLQPAETSRIWAVSISLAATLKITLVFFSSGYWDVSVPRVSLPVCTGISQTCRDGLSHSGTCGSIRICQSPQFFAACHALLRLREPRHPPYALSNFLVPENLYVIIILVTQCLFSRFFLPLSISIMPKNFLANNNIQVITSIIIIAIGWYAGIRTQLK